MSPLARLRRAVGREARDRLGEILKAQGVVTAAQVDAALEACAGVPARLGEVLIANGAATPEQIARALAQQAGLRFIDLDAAPPDPELVAPHAFETLARRGAVPWRRLNGALTEVVADPEASTAHSDGAAQVTAQLTAVAARPAIEAALQAAAPERWAAIAAETLPAAESARAGLTHWQRFALFLLLSAGVFGLLAAPQTTAALILLALSLLVSATAALRVAVLWTAVKRGARALGPPEFEVDRPYVPPRITLLIPLYREARALKGLIAALKALDYPKALIDAKLLVEAEDRETQGALLDAALPPWVEILSLPPGGPRTKPRALNAALPFARGEIVGIYDAEDRPEPDQLRKIARAFRNADPAVACLQCRLAWRNARENWLGRCFAIEYAIWFDLLLAGLRDLRLPIPLGGASVFFRADILRKLGGWDSHNVTEDADLGLRLARKGYRAELVDSTTLEEAPVRPWAWIRQRSRWVKGYMQTWLVHLRRPGRSLREFGAWGFVGMQVLFLGAILTYLAQPLFWAALGWRVVTGEAPWPAGLPDWFVWPVLIALGVGQIAMLGTALLALWRRNMRWLWPWTLTLPIYWPLGALAAYKALWEMIVRPFFWDKTEHGVSRMPDRR